MYVLFSVIPGTVLLGSALREGVCSLLCTWGAHRPCFLSTGSVFQRGLSRSRHVQHDLQNSASVSVDAAHAHHVAGERSSWLVWGHMLELLWIEVLICFTARDVQPACVLLDAIAAT